MKTITSGTIHVFTFKDGILARLAHDLRLTLMDFEVHVDDRMVRAVFFPASLKVDGTMRKGKLDTTELSTSDHQKIHKHIVEDVLHTSKYPEIRFEGEATEEKDDRFFIDGQLEMHGRFAPIKLNVTHKLRRYRGFIPLQPSKWGIAPFKALGGAIKLQDRVEVTFDLPDLSNLPDDELEE